MIWLFPLALAGEPQSIEVTYTATFEMDQRGDQLCNLTQLCDCATTYKGAGKLVEKADDHLTFQGTWAVEANTCSDKLTVWVPKDGAAFHTIRRSGDGLEEWIVHRTAAGNVRLNQGMKQNGQYWINELGQPWKQTSWAIHQEDGTTLAMGVKLAGRHDLAIALGE
ncbi:MAG: hypothetical protein H6737_08815 [Alphaproteobacteria bacterium]|nr:hypothetical protein [Alphaproteobacteria bacterium]